MLDKVTLKLKLENLKDNPLRRCKPFDQELIAQCMVTDYLDEIVKSDEFVSLFSGFTIWVFLTCSVSLSYMSSFENVEAINTIQGFIFVILCIAFLTYMANVYNSSIQIYQKLCVISAIQKSIPRRRLWTYIQEYYIEKQKICYSIFNAIQICLQTQLKVS